MERIGFAASKMAQGNIALYNCYVVLISLLVSLFIFILAGSVIVFALIIIAYVANELMSFDFEKKFWSILSVCLGSLTVIMTLFNLIAISKNLKLPKSKK